MLDDLHQKDDDKANVVDTTDSDFNGSEDDLKIENIDNITHIKNETTKDSEKWDDEELQKCVEGQNIDLEILKD